MKNRFFNLKMIAYIGLFLTSCLFFVSCKKEEEKQPIHYDSYEVVCKTYLNVREQPSPRGKKIGVLNNGDIIKVMAIQEDWALVEFDPSANLHGYVATEYIRLIQETTSPNSVISQDNITTPETLNEDNKVIGNIEAKSTHALIYDNANILSLQDREKIEDILSQTNINAVIWTQDSVSKENLLSFNEDVLSELKKTSGVKDFTDSISILKGQFYCITFIAQYGLMDFKGDSNAMKVLTLSHPEEYFAAQMMAQDDGLVEAISYLMPQLEKLNKEYPERNWFYRKFSDIISLDVISDEDSGLLFTCVLPSGKFWYKYCTSWLFGIPRVTALYLIGVCDSMFLAFLVLCSVLIVLLNWMSYITGGLPIRDVLKNGKVLVSYLLAAFLRIGIILSLSHIIMYSMLDLTGIYDMIAYGYSTHTMDIIAVHNASSEFGRSWIIAIIFGVVAFVGLNIQPFKMAAAFLPDEVQKNLAKNNPDHFEKHSDSLETTSPYMNLTLAIIVDAIWKSLVGIIGLVMFLNGTAMLYVTILMSIIAINRLCQFIKHRNHFKKVLKLA